MDCITCLQGFSETFPMCIILEGDFLIEHTSIDQEILNAVKMYMY